MRTRAQLCNCANVVLLTRSQPVETPPEEALVQALESIRRRAFRVLRCHGRVRGDVPGVIAPFLQEVRVPACLLDDDVQRTFADIYSLPPDRFPDRILRGLRAERSDIRVLEQSFGVGFGLPREAGELRESRTKSDEGKTALCHLVRGHDQRSEVFRV